MKAWLRYKRMIRWLPALGLILALALVVNRGRGQPLPGEPPECAPQQRSSPAGPTSDEPPMADAPPSSPSPHSPSSPYPHPSPLPPGQSDPYASEIPFVPGGAIGTQEPVVRLRVRAPAKIQPDKKIEYRLTVENVSQADAHHVLVRDRLPTGLDEGLNAEPKETRKENAKGGSTDLIWDLGTLKGGEKKDIVLSVKPKGTEQVQNSAYVQFEHGQTVKTTISKPALSLRMSAPAETVVPQSIPIRLEVTNNGETPAQDVVVKCELPEGLLYAESKPPLGSEKPLLWKLGTLNPGATSRVELQAAPPQTGTYTCKAEVSAAGGHKKQASVTIRVGEAKISVSTSGPLRRLENRPIPYLITVSNPGTMPLKNVQVSDEVPPGIQFDSASLGGRLQQGQVLWSFASLAPGERRLLRMVIRAPKKGWCGNAVTVRADKDQFEKVRSNLTRIDASSDPAIEIDKDAEWLEVGQKATYTIRIVNPGQRAVLRMGLVIKVPDALSILNQRGKTSGQREGQIVRFDPLEALNAKETQDYFLDVQAIKAGEARLRVHWTDGRKDSQAPEEWEDSTTIREVTKK